MAETTPPVLPPSLRLSLIDIAADVWQAHHALQRLIDNGHMGGSELKAGRLAAFTALTRLNELGVPIPRLPNEKEMNR